MVQYYYDRYGRPIKWNVEWTNFDDDHREDLFHSTVGIHESTGILRTCNLIIDHEATINLVSAEVVDNFKLPIITHPYPYSFRWFKDGSKVKVTKQVLIHFKLGNFTDKVLCDIVPMNVHHLLLGMPWLDEKCVMYDGSSTRYYIDINGKRTRFTSMTQQRAFQIHKEQEVRDAQRANALREETKKKPTIVARCAMVVDENMGCEQFVEKKEEPELVDEVGGGILFPHVEEENCSSIIAENSIFDNFCVETDEEVVEFLDKLDIFVDTHAEIDDIIEEIHVESNLPLVEYTDVSLQVIHHCDDLIHVPESILSMSDISDDATAAGSISQLKDLQETHNYFDPFDVFCIPLVFAISDLCEVGVKLGTMMVTELYTSSFLGIIRHYMGLLMFARPKLVFDPGGFEDESFSKCGRMM